MHGGVSTAGRGRAPTRHHPQSAAGSSTRNVTPRRFESLPNHSPAPHTPTYYLSFPRPPAPRRSYRVPFQSNRNRTPRKVSRLRRTPKPATRPRDPASLSRPSVSDLSAAAMSTQSISPASASAQFAYPATAAGPSYFPVPFHLQAAQYPAWPTPAAAAPAYSAVYPMPQVQQVQQLFQKDSQIITPEALASVKAAIVDSEKDKKAETNKKVVPRKAAGQCWEDPTLADWPENDFRMFCGDLGNEVNDDVLTKAFSKYPSFNMARVIRDKFTGKTKGYGFASFANASDLAAALKEMNGKYVGNRPIKLCKSTWKNRIDYEALQKPKTRPQKKLRAQKSSVLHK